MMGHHEKLKGGDEYDAFTSWRRVIAWNGITRSQFKKRFNRRIRRDRKMELKQECLTNEPK